MGRFQWTLVVALMVATLPAPARAQCPVGQKVLNSCAGYSFAGCCTADNKIRWCENNVTCELDCSGADPASCGWKADAGFYDCGAALAEDPSCQNPLACIKGGCLPSQKSGCCNCPCQACVCAMDDYCCDTKWDSICANECRNDCGGCGSITGCEVATTPGCHACACETCVCLADPYCCTVKWDSACAQACGDECGGDCGCQPDCGGKQCGPDGCGGSCGQCAADFSCVNGMCKPDCLPDCAGKQCGDDGCGGSCGQCPPGFFCSVAGLCEESCQPLCEGKQCGDDGCGGSCGDCPGGFFCNDEGICVEECPPQCDGKECGDDGCGGSCGDCPPGHECLEGLCECTPSCLGKVCGDDGCGGSCGTCGAGEECVEGGCQEVCIPKCINKECGDDGCGGECGTCPAGWSCSPLSICVQDGPPPVEPTPDVVTPPSPDLRGEEETTAPDLPAVDLPLSELETDGAGIPVPPSGECPDGMVKTYGKCVPASTPSEEGKASSGCSASPDGSSATLLLFLALLMVLHVRRKTA
jgi:uncharacterized protein (TIGR03382 family)